MTLLLEKLLDFCASLKLALFVILALAFYLASATFYERQYGSRAVQEVIYGSKPFVMIMALLAINVMAAVIVRFPWKKKQTGFIITHAGIEVLLAGCLISMRASVDGRVSLVPGQKTDRIDLNDEVASVTLPDSSGKRWEHSYPLHLWKQAGYPGLAQFVGQSVGDWFGITETPDLPRWPAGEVETTQLGPGAKLEILDWLPAAKHENGIKAVANGGGAPAAVVHLSGRLPNGMPMDETAALCADGIGNGMSRPFNGLLELTLWKARSQAEVDAFMHPPAIADLPERGRVSVFINDKPYTIDVKPETTGKDQPLGDSGFSAGIDEYLPHQKNNDDAAQGLKPDDPIDPQVRIHITDSKSNRRQYLVMAWYPQVTLHMNGEDVASHGSASPDDPLMIYDHPAAYFTDRRSTRGRLHLIQGPDDKLYARIFNTQKDLSQQPMAPFAVALGKEIPAAWLNISMTVAAHVPSGALDDHYRPALVEANKLDEQMRALKVALTVDGERQEAWLARGDQPMTVQTPRGQAILQYGFDSYELPFSMQCTKAEQRNDPGSNDPAGWTTEVAIDGTGGKEDGTRVITLNNPTSVAGLLFFQSSFQQLDGGQNLTTLGVRYDPGIPLKYGGSLLIVGGIFTMFYMKAYFQKSPIPNAETANLPFANVAKSAKKSKKEKRRAPAAV
jgi:hypothetical protein